MFNKFNNRHFSVTYYVGSKRIKNNVCVYHEDDNGKCHPERKGHSYDNVSEASMMRLTNFISSSSPETHVVMGEHCGIFFWHKKE